MEWERKTGMLILSVDFIRVMYYNLNMYAPRSPTLEMDMLFLYTMHHRLIS